MTRGSVRVHYKAPYHSGGHHSICWKTQWNKMVVERSSRFPGWNNHFLHPFSTRSPSLLGLWTTTLILDFLPLLNLNFWSPTGSYSTGSLISQSIGLCWIMWLTFLIVQFATTWYGAPQMPVHMASPRVSLLL